MRYFDTIFLTYCNSYNRVYLSFCGYTDIELRVTLGLITERSRMFLKCIQNVVLYMLFIWLLFNCDCCLIKCELNNVW